MFSNGQSFSNGHSMGLSDGTCPEPWVWRLLGLVQPGAVSP